MTPQQQAAYDRAYMMVQRAINRVLIDLRTDDATQAALRGAEAAIHDDWRQERHAAIDREEVRTAAAANAT